VAHDSLTGYLNRENPGDGRFPTSLVADGEFKFLFRIFSDYRQCIYGPERYPCVAKSAKRRRPAQPLSKWMSVLGIIPRLETFGVSVPVGILKKPQDQWSKADQWTMWLWCARGSAILVDMIYTAVSVCEAESKWLKTFGPALKTTMGVGLEAIGGVASYYQLNDSSYSDWIPTNDWIRPIPVVSSFYSTLTRNRPLGTLCVGCPASTPSSESDRP
jgi:hypothetical protein